MNDQPMTPPPPGAAGPRPGGLGAWCAQGLRVALLRAPRWDALEPTPTIVLSLLALSYGLTLVASRLAIDGDAHFNAQALLEWGWLSVAGLVLAAWLAAGDEPRVPAAAMVAMTCALALVVGVAGLPLHHLAGGADAAGESQTSVAMLVAGVALLLWYHLAQGLLLWRSASVGRPRRVVALVLALGTALLGELGQPPGFWHPVPRPRDEAPGVRFRLTQPVFEAQAQALERDLAGLGAQRAGVVDVYAIGYAPDAGAEVFGLETAMVTDVLRQRYGAQALQLVNRYEDEPRHAWATPQNLRRAIERAARHMDRDEDILVIHLASHGVRSGELTASFLPLEVDRLTPQDLRRWLDEAGVRHRVVSVSACYSGGWIAALAGDGSLVMTAADADHTSYGCGRGSQLTYFGRAVFDEAMRGGASFEAAMAAARPVIEQREKAAGKKDGFSNPQIAVGDGMRRRLRQLDEQARADANGGRG